MGLALDALALDLRDESAIRTSSRYEALVRVFTFNTVIGSGYVATRAASPTAYGLRTLL